MSSTHWSANLFLDVALAAMPTNASLRVQPPNEGKISAPAAWTKEMRPVSWGTRLSVEEV